MVTDPPEPLLRPVDPDEVEPLLLVAVDPVLDVEAPLLVAAEPLPDVEPLLLEVVEVVVPELVLDDLLDEQAVSTPLAASAAIPVMAVTFLTRRRDRSRSAAAVWRCAGVMQREFLADLCHPSKDAVRFL